MGALNAVGKVELGNSLSVLDNLNAGSNFSVTEDVVLYCSLSVGSFANLAGKLTVQGGIITSAHCKASGTGAVAGVFAATGEATLNSSVLVVAGVTVGSSLSARSFILLEYSLSVDRPARVENLGDLSVLCTSTAVLLSSLSVTDDVETGQGLLSVGASTGIGSNLSAFLWPSLRVL
jgi:hypothetical protein